MWRGQDAAWADKWGWTSTRMGVLLLLVHLDERRLQDALGWRSWRCLEEDRDAHTHGPGVGALADGQVRRVVVLPGHVGVDRHHVDLLRPLRLRGDGRPLGVDGRA